MVMVKQIIADSMDTNIENHYICGENVVSVSCAIAIHHRLGGVKQHKFIFPHF